MVPSDEEVLLFLAFLAFIKLRIAVFNALFELPAQLLVASDGKAHPLNEDHAGECHKQEKQEGRESGQVVVKDQVRLDKKSTAPTLSTTQRKPGPNPPTSVVIMTAGKNVTNSTPATYGSMATRRATATKADTKAKA
jgi:hypothetical protein